MSGLVFAAVLLAALLHAAWNALVKGGSDNQLGMIAVVFGHVPLAMIVLLSVPAPAPASWPYLAVGVGLHVGYQLFLLASYRLGDLTQVYPIARGVAPMLVALVSVGFLGVQMQTLEIAGILTIGVGIFSLMLVRATAGGRNLKAGALALITGCFIAAYSLVDGTGARLAGTALGFFGWLAMANALVIGLIFIWRQPGVLGQVYKSQKRVFIFGGSASFIAFATVIWAFTQSPIAQVAALRETSIIFALLIGSVYLKERINAPKILATLLTLLGAALLRISSFSP